MDTFICSCKYIIIVIIYFDLLSGLVLGLPLIIIPTRKRYARSLRQSNMVRWGRSKIDR